MSSAQPDLSRLRIERAPSRGSGTGRGGWIAFVLLLLASGAYVAWREGLIARDERPRVSLGRVERSEQVVARSGTSANGYIVARKRAALSTDIQGRIVELLVQEGDRVVEGQLVARLDTRQLEASAAQAKADLVQAQAAAELARLDRERYASLLPTGDVDESLYDSARLQYDEALASIASIDARLREIEVMLDKSKVYAPFAGVITAKNAEVGEVVSALGSSGPDSRGAVATLVDFDTLEVQVELAQTSLGAAIVGSSADVYLDAFPEHAYPGRVRQIWPTANRQKATVEVRVEFLERDERILPEMGVRVVFHDRDTAPREAGAPSKVLVPEAALVRDGDVASVFVLEGTHVTRRAVDPSGDASGGLVPVASGLSGGERVVLAPPPGLADGAEVVTGDDT
ncbi:MAG: efflux RND transporter periplasmic adaptor subunit [Planctomycetes bacterium]|nr:efflux RND transporter periplasmic adaptor subunit [Planctomycetota bacterium]